MTASDDRSPSQGRTRQENDSAPPTPRELTRAPSISENQSEEEQPGAGSTGRFALAPDSTRRSNLDESAVNDQNESSAQPAHGETNNSQAAPGSPGASPPLSSADSVRSSYMGRPTYRGLGHGPSYTPSRDASRRPSDTSHHERAPPVEGTAKTGPVLHHRDPEQHTPRDTQPPTSASAMTTHAAPSPAPPATQATAPVPASAPASVLQHPEMPEPPQTAASSSISTASAPPYSANPYMPNSAAANSGYLDGDVDATGVHASDRASHVSQSTKSTNRLSIKQSFRSLLRKKHDDADTPATKESGDETESLRTHTSFFSSKTRKTDEELAEEHERRQEDPHHLLDTILEEDSDGSSEKLVTLQDAAAVAQDDSAAQNSKPVEERKRGYKANLIRRKRLISYTKTSEAVGWLHSSYVKMARKSMLVRVFVLWFPLALILFVPLACGAWQNPDMRLGHTRVLYIFIWLEVSWGTLCFGKIFAHYVPEIYGFLVSIICPRYFKYVDMFVSLELSVQMLIWTFVQFISFAPLVKDTGGTVNGVQPGWKKVVQNICVAFLVSAIVFFIEQVFLYFLSTNFHKTRMALRIQRQKKAKNILIILLDAAYKFFPVGCEEFAEEDEFLQFATVKLAQTKVGGLSKNRVIQNVSKFVGNAARNVGNAVSDVGNVYGLKSTPSKTVKDALTHHATREVLANRIWKSLVLEDSTALSFEDLLDLFGQDKKEEVRYMMEVLAADGHDVELQDMIDSVDKIGKEGKAITRSLVDIDGAITKLHYVLMFICLLIIIIIFVGMLAPSASAVLATLGSTMLSFSFLFSTSAQEVFVSCIFVFVKHPYDIGDWVQTTVPSLGLTRMQVLQLNLTYTVFTSVGDNTRRQVAHAVLNTCFIDNITRSPPSNLTVNLVIGIPETTNEQLCEFERRLSEFVEENPREYAPGVYFQITDHPDLDRMALCICISTRNNQDDIVLYASRKSRALEYIGQCIREIPIAIPRREDLTHTDPSLPLFHYNITDVDEAMKFSEKAFGKRQRLGFKAPQDGGDEFIDEAEGINKQDEENVERKVTRVATQHSLKRQPSFGSRYSRNSAFSSSSRNFETGLRSRASRNVQYSEPSASASGVSGPSSRVTEN